MSPRQLEATGGIAHSPVALTETGLFEVVRHYRHTPPIQQGVQGVVTGTNQLGVVFTIVNRNTYPVSALGRPMVA